MSEEEMVQIPRSVLEKIQWCNNKYYTGPKLIVEEVVDLKVEDPDKKALLEALGEYYDQFEVIGCKTPEEAVRIGLDAFFGKLKEPKVLPDMELSKIDDFNASYSEGKRDGWREIGGVHFRVVKNREQPYKIEMRGDK